MTGLRNRRWLIADRPLGRELALSDFRMDETEAGAPGDGEVLIKTLYLSFDPSQKGFMENVASYAEATSLNELMPGTGVGQVVESKSAAYPPGTLVRGPLGWQEYALLGAAELEPVPDNVPLPSALGVLGMTGRTAYFGLLYVGCPRPGDTVVISSAAGAVGSVAGQIAKLAGCRVVGIVDSEAKREMLLGKLGFDAAIDYRSEKLRKRLRELCPAGIDVFYDNVGGSVLDDCLARLAMGARVVICGAISRYNADPRNPEQLPPGPQNYFNVVFTRSTIQGFLVQHFAQDYKTADRRLAQWLADGRVRQIEDILEGFENAPRALIRLFEGANIGKQLLRVAEPTAP